MLRAISISLANTLIIFTLISCGGGGGSAGIGGTGITSGGTITGFGSIFVNGVEYDTSGSTITINDNIASESDLKLGMFVLVRGTLDNNTTGSANSISINIELKGPVAAAPTIDPNNNTTSFVVLGNKVIASASSTVFDGSGLSFNTLAMDDVVEIHGYLDSTDTIQATRVEKLGTIMPGSTEVELNGTLGTVSSATSFVLNTTTTTSITVNHDGSTDMFSLATGTALEVKGTLTATDVISASDIEQQESLLLNTDDDVEIEGIITDYVDDSNFKINGIQIDAGSAVKQPSNLSLADDVKVEVDGSFSNNILMATEIEARSGEVKIHAVVSDVTNVGNNKISLSYDSSQAVEVTINNLSKLEDDTSSSPFTISDIMDGDYLEITGYENAGDILVVDLKRDTLDTGESAVLKGDVTAVGGSTGAETIEVLGVTYLTDSSTVFEFGDSSKTRTQFFAELNNRLNSGGDTTVKIEDDWRTDSTVDGAADKLELD